MTDFLVNFINQDMESSEMDFETTLNNQDCVFDVNLGEFQAVMANLDYLLLQNKPKLNSVELIGNKNLIDVGIDNLTNTELEEILK